MYAIDNDTATTTLPVTKPVGIPGFFTAGTVGGQPATIVEADWLNLVQQEVLNVLQAAAIAPSKSAQNQLIQAILWLIANNTRQRLTGPLTLYVNAATGSDTNNGLTPTTAFATPQAAWNYVMQRLDVGGQNITINMADGTYPPLYCYGAPVGAANGSSVEFVGDTVSPASCVISNPNGVACQVALGALVGLKGIRFQAAGAGGDYMANGWGLVATSGGTVWIANVDFGACTAGHMLGQSDGTISSNAAPYSISGNAAVHIQSAFSGGGVSMVDSPVTIYNTPTFGVSFVYANSCGSMDCHGMTFNGAAHGPRFIANTNGIIDINGANPETFFPGDANGSTSSGGQVI